MKQHRSTRAASDAVWVPITGYPHLAPVLYFGRTEGYHHSSQYMGRSTCVVSPEDTRPDPKDSHPGTGGCRRQSKKWTGSLPITTNLMIIVQSNPLDGAVVSNLYT